MLIVNDIKKTFNRGSINEKTALNGVTLHLKKGDFVTIIGSNGAGKSTLMNAISGEFFSGSRKYYYRQSRCNFCLST